MPHQYGIQGYNHNPPSSPNSYSVLHRPGSSNTVLSNQTLHTTSQPSSSAGSRLEEKKLTRDAMENYLKERNDMIIVILHAKVTHVGETL